MNFESFSATSEARALDASADPIREFYTNHPFPPPLDNLDRALELYKDDNVRRSESHLLWPNREYRADVDVLIAGCGTWQAAKYALCHPDARIKAIDVSTTSLQHTERLKQKYNLTNLEVRPLSIESVGDLNHSFDHIICTGVLHHLADPDAGLRALRSVLNRDGAMYLMVYAPYGRAGIYMVAGVEDHGHVLMIFTHPSREVGFWYSPDFSGPYGYNPGDEGDLVGPWHWFNSD